MAMTRGKKRPMSPVPCLLLVAASCFAQLSECFALLYSFIYGLSRGKLSCWDPTSFWLQVLLKGRKGDRWGWTSLPRRNEAAVCLQVLVGEDGELRGG